MVGISILNKENICAIATKLINLGIDFEYQVKDNCILIYGVTKQSILSSLSSLGIKEVDVFDD